VIARAAALALGIACAAARAEYTIVVDMAQPDELTATLKLPKGDGAPHRLDVRGAAWGLHPQVHSAACGAVPLKQQKNGTWIADASCREVTWKVSPVVALDGSTDASKQATLLFKSPRWVLLSEPTSLLRLVDDTSRSASTITIRSGTAAALGATPAGKQKWRVPSAGNAPEIFIVGEASTRSRTIGPFEVRYVADDPKRSDELGLEGLHQKALEYLAKILPPPAALPASERTLLIVWVGIDERRGRAGGAAGSRSFVANYVIGKPETARLNAARTLMVVAHEQFHQLADLVRGPVAPLSEWLNEGLAAYYGLKTLLKAAPGAEAESIRAKFNEPGASFWAAIDDALSSHSAGASDLDALLPELLRAEARPGERLPAAFVATLRASLGAQVDALLAKYGSN
jgi:hypothetical protein